MRLAITGAAGFVGRAVDQAVQVPQQALQHLPGERRTLAREGEQIQLGQQRTQRLRGGGVTEVVRRVGQGAPHERALPVGQFRQAARGRAAAAHDGPAPEFARQGVQVVVGPVGKALPFDRLRANGGWGHGVDRPARSG